MIPPPCGVIPLPAIAVANDVAKLVKEAFLVLLESEPSIRAIESCAIATETPVNELRSRSRVFPVLEIPTPAPTEPAPLN